MNWMYDSRASHCVCQNWDEENTTWRAPGFHHMFCRIARAKANSNKHSAKSLVDGLAGLTPEMALAFFGVPIQ